MDYQDPYEKRAHFGQKRVKALSQKYDEVLQKRILEGHFTSHMKRELIEMQVDFENEKRLLLERQIQQSIRYLEDPKNWLIKVDGELIELKV